MLAYDTSTARSVPSHRRGTYADLVFTFSIFNSLALCSLFLSSILSPCVHFLYLQFSRRGGATSDDGIGQAGLHRGSNVASSTSVRRRTFSGSAPMPSMLNAARASAAARDGSISTAIHPHVEAEDGTQDDSQSHLMSGVSGSSNGRGGIGGNGLRRPDRAQDANAQLFDGDRAAQRVTIAR